MPRKKKPTTRVAARQAILDAANAGRLSPEPYRINRIDQAVQRVRNRRLIDEATLVTAGFRATGPNRRVKS